MSRAAAQAPVAPPSTPRRRRLTARILLPAVLGLVSFLVLVLLVASLLPPASLVGRLLGAAGEARSGSFTQELVASVGDRLRLTAAMLLTLVAGLVVLRRPLQDLVTCAFDDLAWPMRPSRSDIVAAGVPLLLGVALRLAFINQPMRYDEALTFNEFASRPLYYALSFYPDPNNHLLNTLLVHVAFVGLGNQPWVLRLPALLGGVLLVLATYWLSRQLYGSQIAAFLAALLIAASSHLVEYSTNARGYSLQALCFVGLLCLLARAVRRDSPSALLLAALVAALGAYAVPTMLYGLVVAVVWFGTLARRAGLGRISVGHAIASAVLLGLAVVLMYAPVLVVSGADKLVSNRFVTSLTWPELMSELPASLGRTWALWNRDLGLLVGALLLFGFTVATLSELRRRTVPLGWLAPAVCLVLVLFQRVAPFERVWLFLLPLYFVIASAGLVEPTRGRVPGTLMWAASGAAGVGLAITTLTSASIMDSPETGVFPAAEAVAQTLRGRLETDDAVLTLLPASLPELQYYFPRVGLSDGTLVRVPQEAAHLYVVAPPGPLPDAPAGWGRAEEIGRYPGATLVAFARD